MDEDLQRLWRLALERPIAGGSDGDADGTAGGDPAGDQGGDDAVGDTPPPQPGATGQGAKAPESFINPADLPPELKGHWSRMHSAYTKALNKAKDAVEKAGMVDKFWSDPDFAKQSITEWSQRHGIPVSFGGQPNAGAPAGAAPGSRATGSIPQELIEAIEAELPAELRWMAKPLAASSWKAHGAVIAPMLRETRQKEASQRSAEYEDLATELTEVAPGWEEHEEEMSQLLDFLRSPELRHRRWGSKLQVLHAIVTGNATATREAVRRMGDAARSRTTTGVPGRSTTTNIADRVRGAKSDHEAIQIAAEHAVEELKRAGVAVPP